jgi:hypothetical protein
MVVLYVSAQNAIGREQLEKAPQAREESAAISKPNSSRLGEITRAAV